MGIPKDLFGLYKDLSFTQALYIRARWRVSPIEITAAMLPRNGRIYDMGCGAGLLSNILALNSSGREVIGIDSSEEKIGIAKRSAAGRTNIRFERSDALKAPLASPDAVVCSDLCHHINFGDQEALFRRVYDSLKEGGILVVEEIDKRPLLKYLFALAADKVLGLGSAVYYRSSEELAAILKKVGYETEVLKIDRGYPVAAVLFKCVKRAAKGDAHEDKRSHPGL